MSRRNGAEAQRQQTTQDDSPPDPWALVWGQPYVDSATLAAAIEHDLGRDPHPDFRSRLLVRDAAVALRSFWGARRFAGWLADSPAGQRIQAILEEPLGEPGFPFVRRQLVERIGSIEVRQIFELLGRAVHNPVEVYVAGSIPTLILGLTARPTADIDIVDEVPAAIRRQRATLEKIEADYGLTLGHVQSHYLPANWQQRRHWFGEFGGLRVYLVDVYDIFVSKLSSRQEKHRQDLRVLAARLDRETAKRRLLEDGHAFLRGGRLRAQIEENWRFLFQEPLFPEQTEKEPGKRSRARGPRKLPGRKKKGGSAGADAGGK
jgi:hypothetical protein